MKYLLFIILTVSIFTVPAQAQSLCDLEADTLRTSRPNLENAGESFLVAVTSNSAAGRDQAVAYAHGLAMMVAAVEQGMSCPASIGEMELWKDYAFYAMLFSSLIQNDTLEPLAASLNSNEPLFDFMTSRLSETYRRLGLNMDLISRGNNF